MGAIYGHGGQIDLQTVIICTNFQYPFYTRLRMMFEEIWIHPKSTDIYKILKPYLSLVFRPIDCTNSLDSAHTLQNGVWSVSTLFVNPKARVRDTKSSQIKLTNF